MALFADLSEKISVWFDDRTKAIRKGGGLKAFPDSNPDFADKSIPKAAKDVFSTKEEFKSITSIQPTSMAGELAVPAVRAAFLSTHRKSCCQACSGRLAKYDRAAVSSGFSGTNLRAAVKVQDQALKGQ